MRWSAVLTSVVLVAAGVACRPASTPAPVEPEPGIARALAIEREARISDLRYDLAFDLPGSPSVPIAGTATLHFALKDRTKPLVLDFEPAATNTRAVRLNGSDTTWTASNGHIVIPADGLREGSNDITVGFTAGDASLNRNQDFLYTLFVPARAHLAFPCFDQPGLKGRYALQLQVPAAWQVVANGQETGRTTAGDRATVRFAETKPLPTYLFAFAAGRFSVETGVRGGRTFRMFHRETDAAKVARNRDAIFDLHAHALAWLEEYTGIPYPWGKFDFVAVPAFQFGGMEHAGAILYNASSLLLEESATVNQQLGRASVISHETSHMWFGDLVTMRWFDDVWMKEVFANFMASKIVNPSFPQVNHRLRFLLSNYPSAYDVDRTAGANAIRQPLDNLNGAGSLYGAIIYQKAPIVMRNLEVLTGEEAFREGLRSYLKTYSFGNAAWPDLISILDARTPEDLAAWSHAWVEEPGRPTIRTRITSINRRIETLAFTQDDPRQRGLTWNQAFQVTLGYPDGNRTLPAHLQGQQTVVEAAAGQPMPLYVLPNGEGIAYGQLELDDTSRTYLLAHLHEIADPLTRGSALVSLWEELLRGAVSPQAFVYMAIVALPVEKDELNAQRLLSYTTEAYWKFMGASTRQALAPRLEALLHRGIVSAPTVSLKSAWFRAYRDTALTPTGVEWLERVWRRDESVPGLVFSEPDYIAMAYEIAVRGVPDWKTVLDQQLARTENPDRKARFAFVMPALDPDPEARARVFASLADARNRAHEPWVLDVLTYLHHPLRAQSAEPFIKPSLGLLQQIQKTGDIFFPKNWMDATLGGHSSPAAAQTVRDFLSALPPSYPPRLRMVIEASADPLFRASRM
ncbi:MAG: M1 family aminopeptidase [Vicinamibacterales bacterium]